MVFSSHEFLFYFLPAALLLYYAVPRRGKHLLLTLLSYLFYGWANPLFVVLMLASTLIDYVCGLVISRALRRPWSPPSGCPGCSWTSPSASRCRWASASTRSSR
jgi:alginate O-acetyltransferase complex protein AlgI